MPEEKSVTLAQRVIDSITPVITPHGFGPGSVNHRTSDEFSVMFSAPYDGDASRFPFSPYEAGELGDDEVADLYVLGAVDRGIASVEFEGEALVELLRECGRTDLARRLEFGLYGPFEETLTTLAECLAAFFETTSAR